MIYFIYFFLRSIKIKDKLLTKQLLKSLVVFVLAVVIGLLIQSRVGLGSQVTVLDLDTRDTDVYTVVLAEMMDLDAGHISLASPLGRALKDRQVGEEVMLRLPTGSRRLRITELMTVHDLKE